MSNVLKHGLRAMIQVQWFLTKRSNFSNHEFRLLLFEDMVKKKLSTIRSTMPNLLVELQPLQKREIADHQLVDQNQSKIQQMHQISS